MTPGQAVVELALIAPVVILVLMGTVDLSRAFYYYVVLQNATREAARVAIDFPNEYDDSKVCTAGVQEAQSYISLTCASFVISPAANATGNPPTRTPGRRPVTVTASYAFQPVTPLIQTFTGATLTLQASTTMLTWY